MVFLKKVLKEEMGKYLMYGLGDFGLVLHMFINSFISLHVYNRCNWFAPLTHVPQTVSQTLSIIFVVQRVACLLKKVTQEIERRMSTQAEHLRTVCYVHYIIIFKS